MRGKLRLRRSRVMALGIVLCLLAAVFAFEAKVAWYSPAGSPSAQISALKLQPADNHKLANGISGTAERNLAQVPLPQIFAAVVATVAAIPFRRPFRDAFRAQVSPGFTPPMFRRPPPQS